jgi:hypothetical protein
MRLGANAKAVFNSRYTRAKGVAAWRRLLAGLGERAAPQPVGRVRRAHE